MFRWVGEPWRRKLLLVPRFFIWCWRTVRVAQASKNFLDRLVGLVVGSANPIRAFVLLGHGHIHPSDGGSLDARLAIIHISTGFVDDIGVALLVGRQCAIR